MKRFIFWDYPRASFPYDIMVALILAFIFLTPAKIFDDRPRASEVTLVTNGVYVITPHAELDGLPEGERLKRASDLIRKRYRDNAPVLSVVPIPTGEVKGFMAYTTK